MNINKIKTLQGILELNVGELYDIEKQVERAIGKLMKKAASDDLTILFQQHLDETQEQIIRLERIFELLDLKPRKLKSEGIRGIVSDGEDFLYADISSEVKDVLLTAAARKVEHYEMACYLAASELANMMGSSEVEELLRDSFMEEEAADKRLMEMHEKLIQVLFENEQATASETDEVVE